MSLKCDHGGKKQHQIAYKKICKVWTPVERRTRCKACKELLEVRQLYPGHTDHNLPSMESQWEEEPKP